MSRVVGSSFSSRHNSRPLLPGMFTSSTMTLGNIRAISLRAVTASCASTTSTSATSNVVLSNVRNAGSSSTSRMRRIRDLPFPYLLRLVGSCPMALEPLQ